MPKDTHPTLPADAELVLPERVALALAEPAGAARGGLLALAVGPAWACCAACWTLTSSGWSAPKAATTPPGLRSVTAPGRPPPLGGRRVRVERPRVRSADGTHELPLPTWQAFASTELLDQLALERMLPQAVDPPLPARAGAGRQPSRTGELGDLQVGGLAPVRRRHRARPGRAPRPGPVRPGPGGAHGGWRPRGRAHLRGRAGITLDGTKVPLALADGATKNATVVRDLLRGLWEPGLGTTRPLLVVVDGAKALRRAVTDVVDHPLVQRCQLPKLRNVTDRLPDALAWTVATRVRAAYRHPDPLVAQAEPEALARELDRSHPGAAGSLREAWPRR